MRYYGITRKIDDTGRIVLPNEYRKILGIKGQDIAMMYLLEDGILIKKYGGNCVICDESNDLIELHEKMVCKKCLKKLNEVTKGRK